MMSYYCQLVTFINVSGKMMDPFIKDKLNALQISLVRIISSEEVQICQAALLTENSIIMTEGCSNGTDSLQALLINDNNEMQKITVGSPIAEECRIIRGIDVVQVKVSSLMQNYSFQHKINQFCQNYNKLIN